VSLIGCSTSVQQSKRTDPTRDPTRPCRFGRISSGRLEQGWGEVQQGSEQRDWLDPVCVCDCKQFFVSNTPRKLCWCRCNGVGGMTGGESRWMSRSKIDWTMGRKMPSHLPRSTWGKGSTTVPGTASKDSRGRSCQSSKRRSVVAERHACHAVCQDNSSTAMARCGNHGM
jgi:hypothetical protein